MPRWVDFTTCAAREPSSFIWASERRHPPLSQPTTDPILHPFAFPSAAAAVTAPMLERICRRGLFASSSVRQSTRPPPLACSVRPSSLSNERGRLLTCNGEAVIGGEAMFAQALQHSEFF